MQTYVHVEPHTHEALGESGCACIEAVKIVTRFILYATLYTMS